MGDIKMVDLVAQYAALKNEIDDGMKSVIESGCFINGPQVREFSGHLASFAGSDYVIPCANGTDALQIAFMSLGLERGDEVIVPAFTYVATAEVVALLGLVPVMVDADYDTFNIDIDSMKAALTPRTRAVVPVHLFGQPSEMEELLSWARSNGLYVIEDNAQAMGASYFFSDGSSAMTGTMGDIGCTSFFPSKNLGCYGDGGAIFTNDPVLAERCRMIANHGQREKYHHSVIGCNSRLDTLQAAVLDVKLRHLSEFNRKRNAAAAYYTEALRGIDGIICPVDSQAANNAAGGPSINAGAGAGCSGTSCGPASAITDSGHVAAEHGCGYGDKDSAGGPMTHVYHQYTLKIPGGRRNALKDFLRGKGIPSMVYYPLPLQEQEAFKGISRAAGSLDVSSELSSSVLSLPVYPEITHEIQDRVIDAVCGFFRKGC